MLNMILLDEEYESRIGAPQGHPRIVVDDDELA
jgi:hypothetical protein